MIKMLIHPEDLAFQMLMHRITVSKCMITKTNSTERRNRKIRKGKILKYPFFNTRRKIRPKISKDKRDLNIINPLDLMDIYRLFIQE